MKNFGTLYLLNGLKAKDFNQILHKYSIPRLDELITFYALWG